MFTDVAFLILAAALGLAASFIISKHPYVGAGCVALVVSLQQEISRWGSASLVGIAVGPTDAACLALFGGALINILGARRPPRRGYIFIKLVVCVVAILIAASVVRGLLLYTPGASFNEARGWIYALIAIFWAATLRSSEEVRNVGDKLAVMLAVGLTLVTVAHVLQNGFGSALESLVLPDGTVTDSRPLSSGQALAAGFAGLWVLHRALILGRRRLVWLAAASLSACLLAQNRSSWLALIVGISMYFLAARARARLSLVVGVLVAIPVAAIVLSSGIFDSLITSLTQSAESTRTLDARQEGWAALLREASTQGQETLVFGFPFGHGWARLQSGQIVQYSPHNWYVTFILRVGIVGLVLLCALFFTVILKSIRARNATALALTAGGAVYAWAYSLEWYNVLLIALAFLSVDEADAPVTFSRNRTPNTNRTYQRAS